MNQHVLPKPEEMKVALGLGRKARSRRWMSRGFWLLVLFGMAAAVWYVLALRNEAAAVVTYETISPMRRDIVVSVSATGNIQPRTQVDVSTELSGVVREVLVAENAQVKKGDVLARLDARKLMAQLDRAKAQLAASEARRLSAEATLQEAVLAAERIQTLRKRGLSTSQSADQSGAALARGRSNLAAAEADNAIYKADIAILETDLEKTAIRSPISGVVLLRFVEPGKTVVSTSASTTLFTIAEDLTRIQLEALVDEADIGKVKEGQKASFAVDAYRGESFPGQIDRVSFASEKTDGVITYKAVLGASNLDLRLRPGMTATARIIVAEFNQVLAVPNEALRFQPAKAEAAQSFSITSLFLPRFPRPDRGRRNVAADGTRSLYVLRGDKPVEVKVKTGATDGHFTEVLGDSITLEDKLVTSARNAGR